jgi:hypothetical protein
VHLAETMSNRILGTAWRYHNGTKHSYESIYSNPDYLDWRNQPLLFKIYPKLDVIPLPRRVPQTAMAALSAMLQLMSEATPVSAVQCRTFFRRLPMPLGFPDCG